MYRWIVCFFALLIVTSLPANGWCVAGARSSDQDKVKEYEYIPVGVNSLALASFSIVGSKFEIRYLDSSYVGDMHACSTDKYKCFKDSREFFVFSIPKNGMSDQDFKETWIVGGYGFFVRPFVSSVFPNSAYKFIVKKDEKLISSYITDKSGKLMLYTMYSPITYSCRSWPDRFGEEYSKKYPCEKGTRLTEYFASTYVPKFSAWKPALR